MAERKVKCTSFAFAETDIRKVDDIAEKEQIQSRSEVLRRLVDIEHRRLFENGQHNPPARP